MSWNTLTVTEKAILYLLYEADSGSQTSKKLGRVLRGGASGALTLGQLVKKKTQASYKTLVKVCQGLEDKNFLIAGDRKGRDEPYWPETTKLRLVAKGKKFVSANISNYESDAKVQKELSKLFKKTFKKK